MTLRLGTSYTELSGQRLQVSIGLAPRLMRVFYRKKTAVTDVTAVFVCL